MNKATVALWVILAATVASTVVGWCDECGSPAEMHGVVETVPRDQG